VRSPTPTVAVLASTAALVLAGCGGSSSTGSSSSGTSSLAAAARSSASPTSTLTGQITVLAASSLTDAFTKIGKQFESANPGTKVTFNFGSSAALANLATQGAPVDVFASASPKNMATVVAAKAAKTPTTFAKNSMEIAVPADNPAHITQLSDLAKPGVKVALCVAQAPCGVAADTVLKNAKLTVKPATREADVTATMAKVTLGEVDAAIVYITDVKAAGSKVKGIEIPAAVNATTSYPIAVLTGTHTPALSQAFADFVLSGKAGQVLTGDGFAKP